MCVFEHSTSLPLLRHWADGGGHIIDYGELAGSVLIIRGIYSVYNYDYITVSGERMKKQMVGLGN